MATGLTLLANELAEVLLDGARAQWKSHKENTPWQWHPAQKPQPSPLGVIRKPLSFFFNGEYFM